MTIFKITGLLDNKGFDKRIYPMQVEEKASSFVGEGKRISKSKLMTIDTVFHENHNTLRYFTYCRDGEQQKALDMIKAHIIKKVAKYKEEIDVLALYCNVITTKKENE